VHAAQRVTSDEGPQGFLAEEKLADCEGAPAIPWIINVE